MKSAILLDHSQLEVSGNDEREANAEIIEEAIADVIASGENLGPIEVDDVTVALGCVRDDWEKGDPCPECGSTKISVMNLSEDRYKSEDGEFNFMQKGGAIGPDTSYICGNCTAFLRYQAVND